LRGRFHIPTILVYFAGAVLRAYLIPRHNPSGEEQSMAMETEVISCPACKHLLRVPLDWLGQSVQCPECKVAFKAPVKIGDRLSTAELISPTLPVPGSRKKKLDAMLLVPSFGLLLCGVVGMLVNGRFLSQMMFDQEASREWMKNAVMIVRSKGFATSEPKEKASEQNQQDERDVDHLERLLRWVLPLSLVVSLVVFLGGLSIALRWNYKLAQLGCVLAMINIAHACCIPGLIAGLWGILMLNSEEGRGHFGR
jgi:hypothetical protein